MLSMPFKKNDEQTKEWAKKGARKGYTIEQAQLKKMTSLLEKYLKVMEKEIDGTADYKDVMKLENLKAPMLKIMDKLHASKSDVKMEVDKPIMIL